MSTTNRRDLLHDLAQWMKRHLETLHARENERSYPNYGTKADGYAVAEVPDWEMRQKLEAVEQALKNNVQREEFKCWYCGQDHSIKETVFLCDDCRCRPDSKLQPHLKRIQTHPPCPRCDDRDEHDAEDADGMRNAAEIAGLQ